MSQVRPPLLAIGLLSGAALGYEILLMRLLSIIQWHHFAYMIISLALLGYGFSGTLISVFQRYTQRHFNGLFIGAFVLFALSSVGCFALAQQLPFHAEALLWDPRQIGYLAILFLLLSLPFLFAASAFCMAFMRFGPFIAQVYAFDLIGAGLGALLVIGLLFLLMPLTALQVLSLLALAAALLAVWSLGARHRGLYSGGILVLALMLAAAQQWLSLQPSQFKSLSQTLQIQGTEVIHETSSPLGLVTVVRSEQIPLRHAPGLSLNATTEPPPQLGVFVDGGGMSAITRWRGERAAFEYLDQTTSALAYHLNDAQQVLILGAGPGADVLQAWYHRAEHIDGVELNPQIVNLLKGPYQDFAGDLYGQPFVDIAIEDVRGFLAQPVKRYDVIQLALIDGFNASASGLYALNESYLYTRQALEKYIKHLREDGVLSITRWVKLPPRDTLKLFATAVDALQARGFDEPGRHLLLIRSWQTSTLIVSRSPLKRAAIETAIDFAHSRSFDMAYYPGMPPEAANRFNVIKEPYFYEATQAILSGQRQRFFDNYKFNLRPATDDRPFFHQFFKWSSLEEILSLRGKGGLPLLEWGYLVLVITLAIAVVVSALLILAPLLFLRRAPQAPPINRARLFGYFFAIGLGFLFVEIAFIQKFILLLHHPTYAVSVVLTAFLVFSGLGAHSSSYLARRMGGRNALRLAVILIVALSLLSLWAVHQFIAQGLHIAIYWKILISLLFIAPLAFVMGMPFPLALSEVSRGAPAYVPWAWGINGFASVISAVLATLLAIHWGFVTVVMLGVLLYASLIGLFPHAAIPRSAQDKVQHA